MSKPQTKKDLMQYKQKDENYLANNIDSGKYAGNSPSNKSFGVSENS